MLDSKEEFRFPEEWSLIKNHASDDVPSLRALTEKFFLKSKSRNQNMFEIGDILNEMKPKIKKGHWLDWCHEVLKISIHNASLYRRASSVFPKEEREHVSKLPARYIHTLAERNVPKEERNAMVSSLAIGTPVPVVISTILGNKTTQVFNQDNFLKVNVRVSIPGVYIAGSHEWDTTVYVDQELVAETQNAETLVQDLIKKEVDLLVGRTAHDITTMILLRK